jgi:peroxiredoxin
MNRSSDGLTGESSVPEVGDTAPDFELRRTLHESVRLGDLITRGPVLLLFYVFDFGDI